jgi:hypothetical protein
MTSPTGTVLGVTNVTGMFDKGPNRCVLPGALAAGINHLIERTENERECQNACPEWAEPPLASEERWPTGGLSHRL